MSLFPAVNTAKIGSTVKYYALVILFFLTVLFILYSIFPRELLLKNVRLQSTNYSLSGKYLNNFIRVNPNHLTLQLEHALNLMNRGELRRALYILNVGKFYENKSYRSRAFELQMLILKIRYYSTRQNERHIETIIMIESLVQKVMSFEITNEQELQFWYVNTLQFSLYGPAIYFAQKLDKLSYLSGNAHIVNINKNQDVNIVTLLFFHGEREKARLFVQNRMINFKFWLNKSDNTYKNKTEKEQFYQRKKTVYLSIIADLKAIKYDQLALKFARQYEADFYVDPQMCRKIIKIYLALNALDDAHRVATKRLRQTLEYP
ncbi:MAG: hypothetical protein KAH18_07225 [Psychromonas sp.]|nr:hypothetical protein [Psychromonas sp.]